MMVWNVCSYNSVQLNYFYGIKTPTSWPNNETEPKKMHSVHANSWKRPVYLVTCLKSPKVCKLIYSYIWYKPATITATPFFFFFYQKQLYAQSTLSVMQI